MYSIGYRAAITSCTIALAAALWGCSDGTGPNAKTGGDPTFLRPAAGAPSIANPVVTFFAKKGEDREASMFYHRSAGRSDSTVFVRLRVRARSLEQRPDGSAIADGDSVLITITLVDPARMIVDLQPSGLKFSARDPAQLKISYAEDDEDLNDDGSVDARDQALLAQVGIWRREDSQSPWTALGGVHSFELHEVEVDILGFTSYALAY